MKGKSSLFNNIGKFSRSYCKYKQNIGGNIPLQSYNNKTGSQILENAKTEEVRNLIKELYRDGATFGDGSTAAAIKEELLTGKPVGGRSHIIKGEERLRQIEKILNKNPNHPDKKILKREEKKLKTALNTKGGKKK